MIDSSRRTPCKKSYKTHLGAFRRSPSGLAVCLNASLASDFMSISSRKTESSYLTKILQQTAKAKYRNAMMTASLTDIKSRLENMTLPKMRLHADRMVVNQENKRLENEDGRNCTWTGSFSSPNEKWSPSQRRISHHGLVRGLWSFLWV